MQKLGNWQLLPAGNQRLIRDRQFALWYHGSRQNFFQNNKYILDVLINILLPPYMDIGNPNKHLRSDNRSLQHETLCLNFSSL